MTTLHRAALLGSLAFSGILVHTSAQRVGTSTTTSSSSSSNSSNNCRIRIGGGGESQSVVVKAKAAADLDAFVCGADEDDAFNDAFVVAEAVAEAYAKAVAGITVDCVQQGSTTTQVKARARAEAEATSYAMAIADAFVTSEVCDKCQSVVEVVASSFEEIHLKASAEAELYLDAKTDSPEEVEVNKKAYVESVVANSARAFAQVIASAEASPTRGCINEVDVSTEAGESASGCYIKAQSNDDNRQVDGVAKVAQDLAIEACDEGEQNAEVVVRQSAVAFAEATAHAISEIFGDCYADHSGSACVDAYTSIETTARAQAKAFLDVYAKAITCDCEVDVSKNIAAIQEIIVDAATSAFVESSCANGELQSFELDVFAEATARLSAKAVAEVITKATVGDECSLEVDGSVETCVLQECVGTQRRPTQVCKPVGSTDVAPCCDEDYHCVLRNTQRPARCRPKSTPLRARHVVLEPTCA